MTSDTIERVESTGNFKFGTDDEQCIKFTEIEELLDFYQKSMSYVQTTLQKGWNKKDAFDVGLYK